MKKLRKCEKVPYVRKNRESPSGKDSEPLSLAGLCFAHGHCSPLLRGTGRPPAFSQWRQNARSGHRQDSLYTVGAMRPQSDQRAALSAQCSKGIKRLA